MSTITSTSISEMTMFAKVAAIAGISLFIIFITYIIFISVKSGIRKSRIMKSGIDAKATIISVKDTGARINYFPRIEFELQIPLADGTNFTAKSIADISTVDLSRFQPGAIVDVKYDALDHSNVVIVYNGREARSN